MFNISARREAIERLRRSVERHEAVREQAMAATVDLHERRQYAATEVIHRVELYVSALANSPREFDRTVTEFRLQADSFEEAVQQVEASAARTTGVGSATGVAGTAAGVGIAAFGPTAAMGIATTFGTASTGTAISALSGAAATNAALAWLGGGAIVAGGGGMAGGSALLALAGPVGWGIGGAALVGSGVYLYTRNRSHASKATEERIEVETEMRSLETASHEIGELSRRTAEHSEGCMEQLALLGSEAPGDYREFTEEQKERLAALINHIRSLSQMIRTEVSL